MQPYATEYVATANVAADPVVPYMSAPQLEKAIERTRKDMLDAARQMDFIEAARLRDEMLKLEDKLKLLTTEN